MKPYKARKQRYDRWERRRSLAKINALLDRVHYGKAMCVHSKRRSDVLNWRAIAVIQSKSPSCPLRPFPRPPPCAAAVSLTSLSFPFSLPTANAASNSQKQAVANTRLGPIYAPRAAARAPGAEGEQGTKA